ncbi:BID domain-containing T4SS effector [Bartonella tribocorum]|uniref:BepE protein n=1 Tax=Bartonella tribocorum (strain DSM 28219 / CCUG 45778 / CIP 105476 / IBS 506) TaxID=382640 RepID=A9IWQ0_BART1|nr:BID domain-containing T4SS effector [Bartonella tribocorum]CAK02018.1 BepE protein [Bartonella tribocorum CIP 105476]CDO49283.1 BepH protein [Bartonella tribocorum]
MKKHHPHPEPLYAQVNKQNRGNQRTQNPEEDVLYASVSEVSPLSRGRRPDRKSGGTETDYTEVAPPKREEEILYASVSTSSPLSRGRHHTQRNEGPETDYTEVSPHQKGRSSSPSLTTDQKSVMLLKNPQVQARAEEVIHWSKIVYGDDTIFQKHLQSILTDPNKGKELSDQLAEDPESIHRLAGRSALGLKSQTRRAAEDGFKPLVDAIDDYTKTVEDATKRLSQTPLAEQKRHHHHHHHHRHHERGLNQESPEHSPQRQRHGDKGMAYAM